MLTTNDSMASGTRNVWRVPTLLLLASLLILDTRLGTWPPASSSSRKLQVNGKKLIAPVSVIIAGRLMHHHRRYALTKHQQV